MGSEDVKRQSPNVYRMNLLGARVVPVESGSKTLKDAHDEVEADEDHHLYHTRGWAREMWIASMGFKAVLPPPEEVKKVESAAEAARAERSRGKMM